MYQTKIIDLLNKLVILNNERIEGYETASDKTDEQELHVSFGEFARTSQRCKSQLQGEIEKLGGISMAGTSIPGKFFRVWMEVKSTLTGKNRISVLQSCSFGENKAMKIYDRVQKNNHSFLSREHLKMLSNQSALLNTDRKKVIQLRESYQND
jgi:uncharacterized protein (TIGR02284 family)